jgi:hypothetical protein
MPVNSYKVIVDDNFHYMDKDASFANGQFETLESAVAAAMKIVDDCLLSEYEPGMSAVSLYSQYTSFGEDPWISGPGNSEFSAWEYAKTRCQQICSDADSQNPA